MESVTVPKEVYDTLLKKFTESVKEYSDNIVKLLKKIKELEEMNEAQENTISILTSKLKIGNLEK